MVQGLLKLPSVGGLWRDGPGDETQGEAEGEVHAAEGGADEVIGVEGGTNICHYIKGTLDQGVRLAAVGCSAPP